MHDGLGDWKPAQRGGRTRADVESAMTWRARRARTKLRLAHRAEWQRYIESLFHYAPDYPYDVSHEYLDDWTSDPDYVVGAVSIREYDGHGVWLRSDRGGMLSVKIDATFVVNVVLGNRVTWGLRVFFDEEVAMDLNLITGQGISKNIVVPDLVVLPKSLELPPGQLRSDEDKTFRLDQGAPVPELVMEVLSRGTADKVLGEKKQLYERLGIGEYVVCDTGGQRADDSPTELFVFRLENGAYRQIESDPRLSEPETPAFFSEVLGTHIRIRTDQDRLRFETRLQMYDPISSRWRDEETDREERYRSAGAMEVTVAVLHKFLRTKLAQPKRRRVEAYWREHGLPSDAVDRILAVQRMPKEWRTLMVVPDGA